MDLIRESHFAGDYSSDESMQYAVSNDDMELLNNLLEMRMSTRVGNRTMVGIDEINTGLHTAAETGNLRMAKILAARADHMVWLHWELLKLKAEKNGHTDLAKYFGQEMGVIPPFAGILNYNKCKI